MGLKYSTAVECTSENINVFFFAYQGKQARSKYIGNNYIFNIVEYQKSANLKSANYSNPHAFTNVNSEIQS